MDIRNERVNSYARNRIAELLVGFDEAIHEYAINGNCHQYVNRINRVLYLVQSYAHIFDLREIDTFTTSLVKAYSSLYKNKDICSDEIIRLSTEARSCLFDMTDTAIRSGGGGLSMFSKRAFSVASSIMATNNTYRGTEDQEICS